MVTASNKVGELPLLGGKLYQLANHLTSTPIERQLNVDRVNTYMAREIANGLIRGGAVVLLTAPVSAQRSLRTSYSLSELPTFPRTHG